MKRAPLWLQMILLTLSVMATVANLVVYYRGASGPLPHWMRDLFLCVLPKLLRMQTPRRLDDEDSTYLRESPPPARPNRAPSPPNSSGVAQVRRRVLKLASDLRRATLSTTRANSMRSHHLEQRLGHALAALETVAQQQRRALTDERVCTWPSYPYTEIGIHYNKQQWIRCFLILMLK
jgi:hypothetical protein